MRPAAVVTVADPPEKCVRTETIGKRTAWVWTASLRIETTDAPVPLGAYVLMDALRAVVIHFHNPVRSKGVLNSKEPTDGVSLLRREINAADTRRVAH